ncbi:hypothetical protein UAS_00928 [Enterococcus asini ATCC 700915]|uniref:Mga helix-turn-helix domain-containing protein n=1 Tax=Enterococcus asini ATCC 700915 TaxID=1158606 RepID=R2PUC5_9ENTE|nr:helix-turn-helix domain-containing protein [Enterococcus asini]EOH88167.1 hypothetical protein UAS_00928 [Enterococcus asini ATCC 700915]EOT55964.1 hypothetical protein I579_02328 [Enterococcus asini ATCC 700915]OJG09693.1 hypothetical protein RU94_GL001097 [Enterococcus asini]
MELRHLLSRDQQRQLALLSFFYERDYLATEEELAALTGVSSSILQKDLAQIPQQHPELSLEKDDQGYHLRQVTPLSFNLIKARILNQSPSISLLRLLLFEECQSQTQAAAKLYLSSSTTHRYLEKLAQTLAAWGITIEMRPLRLEGSEVHIRRLYTSLYRQVQLWSQSFFATGDQDQALRRYLTDYLAAQNLPQSNYVMDKLFVSYFVASIRQSLGHQLRHSSPHPFLAEPAPYLTTTIEIGLKPTPVNDLDQQDLLWLMFEDYALYRPDHFQIALATNPRIQKAQEFNKAFLAFLMAHYQLKLTSTRQQEILFQFISENEVFGPPKDMLQVLRHPRHFFLKKTQQFYLQEVADLKHSIQDFCHRRKEHLTTEFLDHLLYLVLQEIPETVLDRKPLKILVMSDLSASHNAHLVAILEKHLGANLDFQIVDQVFYSDEDLLAHFQQFDLLLTTVLPSENMQRFPVMVIPTFIDFRQLDRIHRKIQEIRNEKDAEQ